MAGNRNVTLGVGQFINPEKLISALPIPGDASTRRTGRSGGSVHRGERLAGLSTRFARLGRTPNPQKSVALLLSNYPTKHSRIGNAVGLDTPASAVVLLRALAEAGYDLGELDVDGLEGDALIHRLIAAGGHGMSQAWLFTGPPGSGRYSRADTKYPGRLSKTSFSTT